MPKKQRAPKRDGNDQIIRLLIAIETDDTATFDVVLLMADLNALRLNRTALGL